MFAVRVAEGQTLDHVNVGLDYSRGPGGERCPADARDLRLYVAARMGYDPFDQPEAVDRIFVVMTSHPGGGFAAHIKYFKAGELNVDETFPDRAVRGMTCAALLSPLASYLWGMILPAPRFAERRASPPRRLGLRSPLPAANHPTPSGLLSLRSTRPRAIGGNRWTAGLWPCASASRFGRS